MDVIFNLYSNGVKTTIRLDDGAMRQVLNGFGDFKPAAITDCHISLVNDEKKMMECNVEICGMTPELLLKTARFYFYEMAWEYLQKLQPNLNSYREHGFTDQAMNTLHILNSCCQIAAASETPNVSMLDKAVDYLQSLEDAIRCGQVTFKNNLTDTNVNRNRLATVLTAGLISYAENSSQKRELVQLIKVVVPNFAGTENCEKAEFYEGLERMIDYVNSICD